MNETLLKLSIDNPKEALYYLKEELEKRKTILWTMKNGELIDLKCMSNNHLINTIKLLEKQSEYDDFCEEYIYE